MLPLSWGRIPLDETVLQQAKQAQTASRTLAQSVAAVRNEALCAMAAAILAGADEILRSNAADVSAGAAAGLSPAMLDRLALTHGRIAGMARGLCQIAALPDPIGETLSDGIRPNGLRIRRIRVPIGVIGIIYESRPNVTVDSAGLCLKSGNAVILRGGSESLRSNTALAGIIACAAQSAGLPLHAIQLIESPERDAALTLMQAEGLVDLLIPRGGEGLKKSVLENARVPVLASLGGNCHTYIDASADILMAEEIAINAKVSRPSVCNAMETLLVHADIADTLLPGLIERLIGANVEVRGCERTQKICRGVVPAAEADWAEEYLDLILAVRVVDSLQEALDHIARYGTKHSEAIVTKDGCSADRFTCEVDAACVYVNASTRFTDGFEFGFGAEVAISTQKLHARGPIGLRELTTYKTIISGDGQVR